MASHAFNVALARVTTRSLNAKLTPATRPAEELYDLQADPHETVNLLHDPKHGQVLGEMRTRLHRWIVQTDDQGRFPESDAALRAVLKRWGAKAVNKEYERVRR